MGEHGPRRGEVMRHGRKLHNYELHKSHSSTNVSTLPKIHVEWVGHVARSINNTLTGKPDETYCLLEDPYIHGTII